MQGAAVRLFLGFIVVTVLILAAPTRTIQLTARTLSAEVELTDEPLGWDLTGADVCKPTLDVMADAKAPCGEGEALAGILDGPVTWSRGQRLALHWTPERLTVRLLNDGAGWPAGTTLRVASADTAQNGALAFSGYLSLGQAMSPGATGYVLEGSYTIYEQGLVSRMFGWSPTSRGKARSGAETRCRSSVHRAYGGLAPTTRSSNAPATSATRSPLHFPSITTAMRGCTLSRRGPRRTACSRLSMPAATGFC